MLDVYLLYERFVEAFSLQLYVVRLVFLIFKLARYFMMPFFVAPSPTRSRLIELLMYDSENEVSR